MADQHRRVRAAVITGIGQLVGLVGSTLIGVLVAGTLPPSPRVDAFFAANQIYALALYLGQAVRITAPALLVRAGLQSQRLRDATLVLAACMVAVMIASAAAGGLIVPAASSASFASDVLLLAPAAALHVSAGGFAARLSVVGSFGYAAAAYAAGSMVSGVLLLLTIDAHGAAALAPCLLAGAASVMVIMVAGYARRIGLAWPAWRAAVPAVTHEPPLVTGAQLGIARPAGDAQPLSVVATTRQPAAPYPLSAADQASAPAAITPAGLAAVPPATPTTPPPGTAQAARSIGLGAVPALSLQLLTAVFTVAAGHVISGGTALLSYAFLALFACTTIAITPMSIVLGPELAERWHGDRQQLASIMQRATSLATVVAMPVIAAAFLVGRPLAGRLLGALSPADLDDVFVMLAVLAPSLLLTAAATAATVGITAEGRLNVLAVWLLSIAAAVVVAGVWLARDASAMWQVALAGTIFATAGSVATIYVALGARRAAGLIGRVFAENVPVLAPTALAVVLLMSWVDGGVGRGFAAAALVVLVVHGVIVCVLRGDTVRMLLGALGHRDAA